MRREGETSERMTYMIKRLLDLFLFDEGGAGAGDGAGAADTGAATTTGEQTKNDLKNVQYGKAPKAQSEGEPMTVSSDTADARAAEFERLIHSEEYAELYNKRVENAINQRFKNQKPIEEKAGRFDKLSPVLEMLAQKYGVADADPEALVKAIEEDDSYYEDEAIEKGLTVEQLKELKRLERENAQFRAMAEAKQQEQATNNVLAMWEQQAQQAAQRFPGFDLQRECNNPETGERFLNLLKSGVDVGTAYSVIHMDELVGGAMAYTAQQVQTKTVNDIRARGMRPQENGARSGSAVTLRKSDPSVWTKADRAEVSRRVLRGERIEL